MSGSALSTFLPVLIIVLAMIVWWRATIAILAAFLIAVLAIGVHEVVDRIDQPVVENVIAPPIGADQPAPEPPGRTDSR